LKIKFPETAGFETESMQCVEPDFCNLMTVYISYSLAGCLVVCIRVVKGVY